MNSKSLKKPPQVLLKDAFLISALLLCAKGALFFLEKALFENPQRTSESEQNHLISLINTLNPLLSYVYSDYLVFIPTMIVLTLIISGLKMGYQSIQWSQEGQKTSQQISLGILEAEQSTFP